MIYYALGYFHACRGEKAHALDYYRKAEKEDHSYCFPNRIEEVLILQNALELNDRAAKAAYSLGNFWYAARQYDRAIECWETSAAICPDFPTVWRNLSLAYYNKQDNKAKALEALEKAFRLDENDSRILMELDQLYKRLGYSHERRLAFLETHLSTTEEREIGMTWLSNASRSIINWDVMMRRKH